jgi:hypothetical protein
MNICYPVTSSSRLIAIFTSNFLYKTYMLSYVEIYKLRLINGLHCSFTSPMQAFSIKNPCFTVYLRVPVVAVIAELRAISFHFTRNVGECANSRDQLLLSWIHGVPHIPAFIDGPQGVSYSVRKWWNVHSAFHILSSFLQHLRKFDIGCVR